MTLESNLKQIIGDQAFQICNLAAQLEEAQKRIAELTKEKDEK